MGNKPHATRALEEAEVDKLFQIDFFGTTCGLTLQRTMWWKVTNYFEHEARKSKFGDIKLCSDPNGRRYLESDKEKRGSKPRTGEQSYSHQHSFNPRAYETGTDRCPVNIYEHFVNHRPGCSKESDSPFFLESQVLVHRFLFVYPD